MASADIASRQPSDRPSRRKPFTQWIRNLTNSKGRGIDQQHKASARPEGKVQGKKSATLRFRKPEESRNNPYPQSGAHLRPRQSPASSTTGPLSIATATSRPPARNGSSGSLPDSAYHDREAQSTGDRSAAPTFAETVHSDAGHSKAATTTTHGGALSDTMGRDSTFSSPAQSQHSLTTTLTTIQSTSAGHILNGQSGTNPSTTHHGSLNNPNPIMFSHQFPVSPATPNANTISAIPRHLVEQPQNYTSATANGLLSDNASIITLASSSKRRRRSYDSQTDASVRALAPSSVWGGSRESLPLSVLSGNVERDTSAGMGPSSQNRRSISGLASAERASVYSSSGVAAPALASERNSYYAYSHKPAKDVVDAKSLRSLTNLDARSQYDSKSINTDARSLADVASLKNYEGSIRSGALGHVRQDSLPGSTHSPAPGPVRQMSAGGTASILSSDGHDPDRAADGDSRAERDSQTDAYEGE